MAKQVHKYCFDKYKRNINGFCRCKKDACIVRIKGGYIVRCGDKMYS